MFWRILEVSILAFGLVLARRQEALVEVQILLALSFSYYGYQYIYGQYTEASIGTLFYCSVSSRGSLKQKSEPRGGDS